MTRLQLALLTSAALVAPQSAGALEYPGNRSKKDFHGFARYDFKLKGQSCILVAPKAVAEGRPWIWRARFFGHQPQTDVALLNKGYHVAYVNVGGLFGAPEAVRRWDGLYAYLTGELGFSKKPALEGMSRGGLIIFNWAKRNPNKVSCIYADAPVLDIRSWPGGKGRGKGGGKCWQQALFAYGITEEQAAAFKGNPIDGLKPLADAGVPLLHVCGAADTVVPIEENTDVLEARYLKLGGRIQVIRKKGVGHHPHSLKDPKIIVDFIEKHARGKRADDGPVRKASPSRGR
ncbi:MAG: alpha/beta hydrolase family protein [Planctomycetota bacterium]